MSIVLIKQHIETTTSEKDGKTIQTEFANTGMTAIICPPGVEVSMITSLGNFGIGANVAVINTYGDTKVIRDGADKVKTELKAQGIEAIILPINTDVQVLVD